MTKISEWIDVITQDLVNPKVSLKDILLKVQILAFKLKNEKLKLWVDCELNGYVETEIPDYRTIPSSVRGNLVQNRGFGGFATRNDTTLPIEYLEKKAIERLTKVHLATKISEIERMVTEKGSYSVSIPHYVYIHFNEILANNWQVDAAWQKISVNSLEGILSSVKSNLLNFLLELNEEIGDNDNYSIMENKKDVDNLFEKTIGNITGETVNVQIGNRHSKTVSSGDNANINTSQGDSSKQEINTEIKNDIKEFSKLIKEHLDNLGLSNEDEEDIKNEIQRVDSQINRNNPKINILNTALVTINGILTGITANAYTPIVIEKLSLILSKL